MPHAGIHFAPFAFGTSLFLVCSQQREQDFDDARADMIDDVLRTFADPGRRVV